MSETTIDTFFELDIRVGRVVRAEDFPEARKPAYRLWIDFGSEVGERQSSAGITERYTLEELVGRRVLGVVNLPPLQIGPFRSEGLVLGVPDAEGRVVLVRPDDEVPIGGRLH